MALPEHVHHLLSFLLSTASCILHLLPLFRHLENALLPYHTHHQTSHCHVYFLPLIQSPIQSYSCRMQYLQHMQTVSRVRLYETFRIRGLLHFWLCFFSFLLPFCDVQVFSLRYCLAFSWLFLHGQKAFFHVRHDLRLFPCQVPFDNVSHLFQSLLL